MQADAVAQAYPQPLRGSSGRSIVATITTVPAARFAPHLRVANGFAVVRTAHPLPSGAASGRSLHGWPLPLRLGIMIIATLLMLRDTFAAGPEGGTDP